MFYIWFDTINLGWCVEINMDSLTWFDTIKLGWCVEIYMNSTIWFDTINLGCFSVHIKV